MTGTLTTPTVGQPNSTQDPFIATAITTVNGLLTAANKLDGTQIGAGTIPSSAMDATGVLDADLVSPNNSVYKTILFGGAALDSGAGAVGTFMLAGQSVNNAAGALQSANTSGGGVGNSFATNGADFVTNNSGFFYFDDADYAVGSLTTKLRLRAQVNTNATAWSSVTATFGLYPVTFSGAALTITATLGTVVSGSTVAIANPGASSTTQGNSGDFTIPADGQYVLGCAMSAAITTNGAALFNAQLQTRNV